jgi:hypothetical protein
MPDLGRLKHAVAGLKPKRFTLAFVDDTYSSTQTIDQLEDDLMVVNVIGNSPALKKTDVRSDQISAKPVRN